MKGSSDFIAAAVTFVIVLLIAVMIATVGIKSVLGSGDVIRKKTVDISGQRLERVIYAADNLERADIQVQYREEYGLEKGKETWLLTYEAFTGTGKYRLQPAVRFRAEEGKSNFFCVEKKSSIRLRPGKCDG